MQQKIIEDFPVEDLEVEIVWLDILAMDGPKAVSRASGLIAPDPRVREYHDPEQRSGRAVSASLGWEDVAWDIYLFYEPGVEWNDTLPEPRFFYHQLMSQARDGHFAIRQDLVDGLAESLAELGRGAKEATGKP